MARRSRRIRPNKNEQAKESIDFLEKIFDISPPHDSKILDTAAKQILAIGKKHGKRPTREIKKMICRSCKKSLLPGQTSRIRATSKVIFRTCLRCGRVNREILSSMVIAMKKDHLHIWLNWQKVVVAKSPLESEKMELIPV